MVEKAVLLIGAITGLLVGVVVPIVLHVMKTQQAASATNAPQPTFGLSVETAIERGDAAWQALLAEVREHRDDLERERDELRDRLEVANRVLAANGLPTH